MDASPVPACFNALNQLMPVLRAETARRLVKEGLQQERIAEHLGVSQAMVSKYLRQPLRPRAGSAAFVGELVESAVRIALEDENKGRISPWCPVCVTFASKGFSRGARPMLELKECLRHDVPAQYEGADSVLENLREAEGQLRKLAFSRLMPQVRSNLAMCMPEARNTRDVASFPGRLVEIRGSVQAAAPPDFGSSTHLSQLLLRVRRTQPQSRAILNVRHDEAVRRAARAADLKIRVLQRLRNELVFALPASTSVDGIVDPGAFGVEPQLYLLGTGAIDVVQKAQRLLHVIKNGESS